MAKMKKSSKEGRMRVRKAWQEAWDRMHASTSVYEWLRNLCDLLDTPKHAVQVATRFSKTTGEPIEFKWKVDRKSLADSWTVVSYQTRDYPEFMAKQLNEWLQFFQTEGGTPIVFSSPIDANATKIRTLVVTMESIQTGGGHNDSPTYADAIVIRPVFTINYVL